MRQLNSIQNPRPGWGGDFLSTHTNLSVGYSYTDDLLTAIQTPSTTYNFTYGNFGLRSNIKVGSQVLASYDYTDDGNFYLEKLEYGNGDVVQYTYDKQGRVTAQAYEDGDTVTYKYDNTGALATVTDSATGRTITYYYDFTDRLMKYVESGEGYSHSVDYRYNDLNNLTTLIENINDAIHITEYTYDDSYRVTSISSTLLGVGPNIFCPVKEFTYDGYNRVNDWKIMSNGTALLTETFAYRDFPEGSENPTSTSGQIDNLTISSAGLNRQYFYEYDGNGNITSVETKDKNASGQYESTGETTYVYDTAGQLLWEYNEEAQTAWNWTYDNAGNILTRTEYAYSDGALGEAVSTVTYGYDDDNWGDLLTSYNGKNITYDAIGNPLNDGTWAYTWQHGRQLASMNSEKTTLEFEYNADGIRTKKTVTTTSDHVHSFQDTVHQPKCTENGYTLHECICGYIYQDSPVPATGHDFTTTVVGTSCTEVGHTVYTCECGYSYEDGSNGHTFTTLVVEPSETVNGFTLHECECGYSYESDPVASLAGASDTVDVISDTKVYNYVYNGSSLTKLTITTTITGDGTSTEELYFTYDGSSPMSVTYGNDIFYYVTNLQGDVVAIIDTNGVAVVTYSYDAWGNILSIGGSKATDLGVANPLTYRGYVYDAESALYYLQSRYYNANVGRFLNADDPGYLGADGTPLSYNLFAYCGNNPVTGYDPTGHWDWGLFGKIVATTVIVGLCLTGVGCLAAAAATVAATSVTAAVTTAVATAGISTVLGAVDGAICAEQSGGNWYDGAMAGAIGSSAGALVSAMTNPVRGSDSALRMNTLGRATSSLLYDFTYDIFDDYSLEETSAIEYAVDVVMDVSLSPVYYDYSGNIANEYIASAVNGFIDAVVDIFQTVTYFR